jgi:hypothetical protein
MPSKRRLLGRAEAAAVRNFLSFAATQELTPEQMRFLNSTDHALDLALPALSEWERQAVFNLAVKLKYPGWLYLCNL